ncbi:MAG: beta-L-arabinofuranosidase domain-containing protein [Verrucomicrobiota bacterium]
MKSALPSRMLNSTKLASIAGGVAVGVLGVLLALPALADPWLDANPKLKVKPAIPMKATAFALEDVRLLDGPFKHAMELDGQYLLALEVDRLLHDFRLNAGLPSSARPLGGWEAPSCELRGHFVGHYLSACAQMYASTGDARFKAKGDAVVAGLAECQAKLGSGYLSAYPESFIDWVERQQPVWAPYYTLHKIFAGLEDMYVYCDNTQALELATKFGDWVIARNSRLSDAQMQAMMRNEHGGMNETLANLYSLTGEKKYLDISLRFNHQAVIAPLSQREDRLTGLHANTQIPKFIGAARQFELTATPALGTASEFFWTTVVNERSYVTGGNSDNEHFTPKESLSTALGPKTAETCNTYNMLKLTRHLFCRDPRAECADYYERALYNHILASQNPETGMMCYSVPLHSGSHKEYNSANGDFWCCTGTGVENHSKYGDSIYFHDDQTLYANLFIASELNWQDKGLKLRQETQYPDEGRTRFVFSLDKPLRLAFQVRHPFWATAGYEVRVNGEPQTKASAPGSYATLDRIWKSGDTVEVVMPFGLRTEGFRDNTNRFAILNGPLVLCAEVQPGQPFPVVVGDTAALRAALKPIAGHPNSFTGAPTVFRAPDGQGREMTLEPFYKVYGNRSYVVYWDSRLN